eukprot:364322-Chlamydomonas_euryale.AAC.3
MQGCSRTVRSNNMQFTACQQHVATIRLDATSVNVGGFCGHAELAMPTIKDSCNAGPAKRGSPCTACSAQRAMQIIAGERICKPAATPIDSCIACVPQQHSKKCELVERGMQSNMQNQHSQPTTSPPQQQLSDNRYRTADRSWAAERHPGARFAQRATTVCIAGTCRNDAPWLRRGSREAEAWIQGG